MQQAIGATFPALICIIGGIVAMPRNVPRPQVTSSG